VKYTAEEIMEILQAPQLEGIGERLEDDISSLLRRSGMYFRMFNRVKTASSIANKLNKGGYGLGQGEKKLQDLVGLRVVAYYNDDIEILRKVLDQTFCRKGEWSETDNGDDEFKASKLNGVYEVPEEYRRIYDGDLGDLPIDVTFEVQLRTVSFEGWHEIEHDMRYKSPYAGAFWQNNEDLSRILNSVLANLELCDWSTLTVFERLAHYHYREKNWEMMMRGHFRLRFHQQPLSGEIVEFINAHPQVGTGLFESSRADVIYALMKDGNHDRITFDLVVKVYNEISQDYDDKYKKKLAKLCKKLVKTEKTNKGERLDLNPLEISPSFKLTVTLCHDSKKELNQEFLSAVQIIAGWAQGRFRNVTEDIPLNVEDFEFHSPGYNLSILGNYELGFYKLSLDHVDLTRPGVVWRTSVALERSDRVRMRVICDYCHTPGRLVRESFAKPKFVDEIFRRIGYEDIIPLSQKPRKINSMADLEEMSHFTADHNRSLPVILAVEDQDPERQINIGRLAETVGSYAHVFVMDKKNIPMLVEATDYKISDLMGAVWVTFPDGEVKFYTRDMISRSRFDFNKYAFDAGNVYEKAFRHRLVRLLKEKNCD